MFLADSAIPQEETANIINLYSVDPRKWLKEPGNVYIGRKTRHLPASKWGNPYCIDTKNGLDRPKVIHLFEKYLMNNAELRDSVNELFGKKLGYWCAPQQRHGEILHRSAGNRPVYQTI